tara:strand:- start:3205 stop:3429 length:225 start_codon:yes stop_codon:yes gene_type:complete
MFEIDKNLQIVILIFIGTIITLFKKKPEIMFKKNGKAKEFGSGKDKTIVPVWLVGISLSLLFYVQFTTKKDDFV